MNLQAKIFFIAPYVELAQEAIHLNLELNLHVIVKHALLHDLDAMIESAVKQKVDVLVSRGGIAQKLAELQNAIPVVEIPITGFDALEAITEARAIDPAIAIVGFPNIVHGTSRIAQTLSMPHLKILVRENADDCFEKISLLAQRGIKVIVGDTLAVRTAWDLGLKGVLIKSGRDEILAAYQQAEQLFQAKKREASQHEQLRAILDYAYNGIIAIDAAGTITEVNPPAEHMVGIERAALIGRKCLEVLPAFDLEEPLRLGHMKQGVLAKAGRFRLVLNKVPIIVKGDTVGAVVTLQESGQIEEVQRRLKQESSAKGHIAIVKFTDMVGKSQVLTAVIKEAVSFSKADSPVLLEGETGVGKEMFAQAIHNESPRRKGPFVAVNCAAIPVNLLESELFGYVRGAFTDARRDGKVGLFELADGGTLFLDEIAEIDQSLQVKLLRVLQERKLMRIGDDKLVPTNVRIIASSNQPLAALIHENRFRADLYYRLNILPLQIPPLRDRKDDIPDLAVHFLKQMNPLAEKTAPFHFTNAAIAALVKYDWPGNIRELAATIERAVLRSNKPALDRKTLGVFPPKESSTHTDKDITQEFATALLLAGGNKSRAAQLLGVDRTTLWRCLKKWSTDKP